MMRSVMRILETLPCIKILLDYKSEITFQQKKKGMLSEAKNAKWIVFAVVQLQE